MISFLLGFFSSWLLTHFYYKKSKNDLELIIQTLNDRVKRLNEELISNTENNELSLYETRIAEARDALIKKRF